MKNKIYTFLVLMLLVTSCKETVREKIFDKAKAKIKTNNSAIDLNEVIDFQWDTLYVITPQTPPSELEKHSLRKYWKDLTYQLVFTDKGKVVHNETESYNPEKPLKVAFQLSFDTLPLLIIDKNNANFRVEKEATTREIYTLYPN